MSSEKEREYIQKVLIPEILEDFKGWAKEYQQERDLGARGEFASLYRKARKLKTILWDGADPTLWREGIRTIVKEVVSHGFLLLCDLDLAERVRIEIAGEFHNHRPGEIPESGVCFKQGCKYSSLTAGAVPQTEYLRRTGYTGDGSEKKCGSGCSPRSHLFTGGCRYRLAGDWLAPAEGEQP